MTRVYGEHTEKFGEQVIGMAYFKKLWSSAQGSLPEEQRVSRRSRIQRTRLCSRHQGFMDRLDGSNGDPMLSNSTYRCSRRMRSDRIAPRDNNCHTYFDRYNFSLRSLADRDQATATSISIAYCLDRISQRPDHSGRNWNRSGVFRHQSVGRVSRASPKGFAQLSSAGQKLVERLPFGISQQDVENAGQSASKMVSDSQLGSNAIHTLGAAGETLTGSILILVVLFFFLKDGDRIWAFIISWIPTSYRNKWIASGEQALHTFGGYIRGTAIVAAVDTVGIVAVLLILRVPLAVPLGVLVFFGSFIPIVGATVVGALAVLVALVTNGPVSALIVLAAVVVVNQLEGHFLQPVVMAHTLKLHALVVLLALAIGTALGGNRWRGACRSFDGSWVGHYQGLG